jgi:hypothetical protein
MENGLGLEQVTPPAQEVQHDTSVDPLLAQSSEVAPAVSASGDQAVQAAEAIVETAHQETEAPQGELPPHHQAVTLKLEQAIGMKVHTPAEAALLSNTLRDLRAA